MLFSMWSLIHFLSTLDVYLFTVELGLGSTYLRASFTFFLFFFFSLIFQQWSEVVVFSLWRLN